MKHNLRFYLLAALMSMVSIAASAHDFEVDGIYYNYNEGNSGTSVSVTYQGYSITSSAYSGEVIIPEFVIYNGNTYSVTSIGSFAFYSCRDLTSITIPNSVTSIGQNAFSYCSGLTSITIPNNVVSIGEYAFSECSDLTSITILNSMIGKCAFYGCRNLTSITIGNSVMKIMERAFENTACYNNQSDGIIYIDNWLIGYKGEKITGNLVIAEGTRGIADYALYNCSGLTSITIPNSVRSINDNAFTGTSLSEVRINDLAAWCNINLDYPIGYPRYWRFYINDEEAKDVVIPYGVTEMKPWVFCYCESLTSVTMPTSVTSIGEEVFMGCHYLTSVTIPNSVTSIGEDAFNWCNNLTSLTIPKSVTSIGEDAFHDCSSLESIVVENGNTKYDSRGNCNALIETETNALIRGCNNTIIPSNVTSINNYAFSACFGLTSLSIPNSVISIGEGAIEYCYGLTSINLPNSVESIGSGAFYQCENLTSVTVEMRTPISIDNYTFAGIAFCANTTLYVPMGCKAAYEAADYWNEFDEIKEIVETEAVPVTSANIRTYCSEYDLDFTDVPEVKAYIASGFSPSTGDLLLTRVYKVPAGVGLILKAEEGEYEIPHTVTNMYYANLLVGVLTPTTISPTDGGYVNYILTSAPSHGIGFYTISEAGEIGANKAYLRVPKKDANSRMKKLIFEDEEGYGDEAAGIETIRENTNETFVFNLQGRRIQQPTRGIYIINGKKVIIK